MQLQYHVRSYFYHYPIIGAETLFCATDTVFLCFNKMFQRRSSFFLFHYNHCQKRLYGYCWLLMLVAQNTFVTSVVYCYQLHRAYVPNIERCRL